VLIFWFCFLTVSNKHGKEEFLKEVSLFSIPVFQEGLQSLSKIPVDSEDKEQKIDPQQGAETASIEVLAKWVKEPCCCKNSKLELEVEF
jgi:hypothetical protein